MTTRRILDQDLDAIRDNILRLSALVNRATERAMQSFRDNDLKLAQEVVNEDDQIDSLHHHLEEEITRTVALQQPMAHDLRVLIAELLITNELERMGDHAEGIARTVQRHAEKSTIEVPKAVVEMQVKVSAMIQQSMDAFVEESPDKAKGAARLDHDVDALYTGLFRDVVTGMGSGELPVDEGTYLLWVGHNLERIGDRVTNICERVVYARTGELGGLNPKSDGKVD